MTYTRSIRRFSIFATVGLVVFAAISAVARADDSDALKWTQFLGPAGDAASSDAHPPIKWDNSNFVWETEIPGTGWSSPVFADGVIWITTAVTEPATPEQIAERTKDVQFAEIKTTVGSLNLFAICVDLETGKILHNIELASVDHPGIIHPLNSYATPTPAISDGKVICHFGNYGTWCLDASSGKEIWKTKFDVDHSVGAGSSPVIYKDKVILACDGIDDQFIAAVSLDTGKQLWKTERPEFRQTNGEYQKGYSTPLIAQISGKTQMIIPGAQWINSYDPETGKELWRIDHGDGFSMIPMASIEGETVVFASGYMQSQFVAIDPSGTGDVTKSHIKWRAGQAPTMPSMVSTDGKIFAVNDSGIMICLDAETGKLLHRRRVSGNYSASMLLAGGNLYVCSREGNVSIIKCDETLEEVGKQKFDGRLLATPAPVGDDLLIRTDKKLYRITGKKQG